MSGYSTQFGSIDAYERGTVSVIADDPKNYLFSNMFDVAARSAPYERVAVAKNFEYVIEVARAEGVSGWFTCAHDEFVTCLDYPCEVHLVKLDDPDAAVDPESEGAHALAALPPGKKMGRIVLRRGHMAILPVGAAYRFEAAAPATLMIQTIDGPVTSHQWAAFCQSK